MYRTVTGVRQLTAKQTHAFRFRSLVVSETLSFRGDSPDPGWESSPRSSTGTQESPKRGSGHGFHPLLRPRSSHRSGHLEGVPHGWRLFWSTIGRGPVSFKASTHGTGGIPLARSRMVVSARCSSDFITKFSRKFVRSGNLFSQDLPRCAPKPPDVTFPGLPDFKTGQGAAPAAVGKGGEDDGGRFGEGDKDDGG